MPDPDDIFEEIRDYGNEQWKLGYQHALKGLKRMLEPYIDQGPISEYEGDICILIGKVYVRLTNNGFRIEEP